MFFSTKKEPQPEIPQINIGSNDPLDTYFVFDSSSLERIDEEPFGAETMAGEVVQRIIDNVVHSGPNCDEEEEEEEEEKEEEEEENTIYVISIDDHPQSYEKDLSFATSKIERLAKNHSIASTAEGMYETYVNYKSENEIEIIRVFDFYLFSYNYVIHRLSVNRVDN